MPASDSATVLEAHNKAQPHLRSPAADFMDGDVLENLDFDSCLKETSVPSYFQPDLAGFEAGLDALYTISEDLAEGKLTHKEKGLKHLVKELQFASYTPQKHLIRGALARQTLILHWKWCQ